MRLATADLNERILVGKEPEIGLPNCSMLPNFSPFAVPLPVVVAMAGGFFIHAPSVSSASGMGGNAPRPASAHMALRVSRISDGHF